MLGWVNNWGLACCPSIITNFLASGSSYFVDQPNAKLVAGSCMGGSMGWWVYSQILARHPGFVANFLHLVPVFSSISLTLTSLFNRASVVQKMQWVSCTIPESISFSMGHTLHPRCVFITCLQIIFWCFERLGSGCWVHFFRRAWHYLTATCKPQARDHSHSYVGQTVPGSCSRSHSGHLRWLMQV